MKEPKTSLPSVIISASVAAAILGVAMFIGIRAYQWRNAMADLRSEPGIQVLNVEHAGWVKKRLRGLRDPLAPTVQSILEKHHLGPGAAELIFAEYHSLNTSYAKERERNQLTEIRAVKDELIASVGKFAEEIKLQRESDLEKITQMLFEARFPEAMESVKVRWEDGKWLIEGELYAPARKRFVADSPAYLIEGEPDFSGLVDLTEKRTRQLKTDIEAIDLLEADSDGNLVHLDRMARLLVDLDEVCEQSQLPLPELQLAFSDLASPHREQIEDSLNKAISAERFLPTGQLESDDSTEEKAHLTLFRLNAGL